MTTAGQLLSIGRMRLGEINNLVWINIRTSKFKVFLTSLGIIVGAATIILVIAVGHGGEVDVQKEYKTLNAGAINVSVSTQAEMADQFRSMIGGGAGPAGGFPGGGGTAGGTARANAGGGTSARRSTTGAAAGGTAGGGGFGAFFGGAMQNQRVTLSTTDVDDISSYVSGLSDICIYSSGTESVNGGDLTEDTDETIVGATSDYAGMSNLELLQGDFYTDDDESAKNKVAVIGYSLAEDIFGSAYSAYGDSVSIEGKTYEIIGVLSKMGSVSSGTSPDDTIFIPYATGIKYVFGNQASPQIMAIASDVSQVAQRKTDIQAVLAEDHPKATFTVTDAGSTMRAATSSADTLSMLLLAVAVIVFIVGGIGIMNVMFVSVKERTQEIGILKALGSSKRDILLEFLLEAMFISVMGGVLGVGAGFALVPLLRLTGMTVEPLAVSGVYSMLFAVGTGTVFGFYPAWQASRLMPIEALNEE